MEAFSLEGVKPRILVVEDEPEIRKLFQVLLEKEWEVVSVECGTEALSTWHDSDFDLVVMDIQIPTLDGITVTQRIREMEKTSGRRRVPIIAVSALTDTSIQEHAAQAGVDEFIPKPFNMIEFIKAIKRHLFGAR